MSITSVITAAAESTSSASGVNPWAVGVGIFVLLLVILFGLVMFGAGRDHS